MMTKEAQNLLRSVMMVVVVVTQGDALPHASLEPITLQLQPEMLRGHRLVLTLEPLSAPTMQSNITSKSLIISHVLSNKSSEQNEVSVVLPTTTERSEPSMTTQMPVSTTEASKDVITLPMSPATPKVPSLPAEDGVDSLLIRFPDLRCSQGYRADPRGKCRPTFTHPFFGNVRLQRNSVLKASQQIDLESENKIE
ncbi:hypothetical protein Hamer_G006990 [Homarus americanus]|uniref:Uncharacterized protein n=1 Tax=Homarus americanus TaxID=6706 RepID=A0A8J5TIN1_HOMAM|nr:hypothetical protein Hamer_G006990 [Homarus americanus]